MYMHMISNDSLMNNYRIFINNSYYITIGHHHIRCVEYNKMGLTEFYLYKMLYFIYFVLKKGIVRLDTLYICILEKTQHDCANIFFLYCWL